MTYRLIRPDQEAIFNGGSYFSNAGGSLAAANKDGSATLDSAGNIAFSGNKDSTYNIGLHADYYVLGYQSYTLASNQRCKRWQLSIRAQRAYVTSHTVHYDIGNYSENHWDTNTQTVGSKGNFGGTWYSDYNGGEITQAVINKVQSRIKSDLVSGGFGAFTATVFETGIALDIRTQPAVQSVTVTGGYTPTVTWAANIYDSQAQTKYWFKIFDLAVNPSPTFTATLGLEYNSLETTSAADHKATAHTFVNGNYRILLKVSKDFNGSTWYSNVFTKNFTLAGVPPIPTLVGPTTAQNTDLPTLTATVARAAVSAAPQVKAEWQVASDNVFTTNLVTTTELDTDFNNGGVHTETIPIVDALFTGTWYVRARAVDVNGVEGSWSSAVSFAVSHPPTAIGTAPDGGGAIIYDSGGTTVEWIFADTSPVDEQTAFQAILELEDGTLILDSGKVSSASSSYSFVVSSGDTDQILRWAVRLWDRDDVVGPYSDYATFLLADVPTVVITFPVDPTGTPQPYTEWTFTASAGRTQVAFRVQYILVSSGGIVHDSGWIASDALNYLPPTSILLNSEDYTVIVYSRDTMGLIGSGDFDFSTSWAEPAGPSFTVDTSVFDSDGYNLVEWTDAAIDADFFARRVYRKHELVPATNVGDLVTSGDFDDAEWELLDEELTDSPTYAFADYGGFSNTQKYAVVQVALRSGAEVETNKDSVSQDVNPAGTFFWLILANQDPNNVNLIIYSFAYKLEHVTADSMNDEWEQEELHLLNRGRRVEYGTYLGRNGTAECHLRDTESGTARDKRLSIEWMKRLAVEQNYDLYFRTPFGDIYKVDASALSFARDAGLGDREHGVLSFPYLQVY